MAAKVFISSGQSTNEEIEGMKAVSDWFQRNGFRPFYAIDVNTIVDLNSRVIEEIKSSDYFVFINFAREKKLPGGGVITQGSFYANQELAIAIALGLGDRMLSFHQQGSEKEGIFRFTICNGVFATTGELVHGVEKSVSLAGWNNASYRHLRVENARMDEGLVAYTDQRTRLLRIAHIDVRNSRPDVAAHDCAMRLVTVCIPGSREWASIDRTPLKVTGRAGAYTDTIWPESFSTFDLFGIDALDYPDTYLLSELDIPRMPIALARKKYILTYEIFAPGFPKVTTKILLDLTEDMPFTNSHEFLGPSGESTLEHMSSHFRLFSEEP